MKNQLEITTSEGEKMFVYLYMGYRNVPVVSFQTTSEPSGSPNPYCYDFETFLNINGTGLMIEGNFYDRITIEEETVKKVKDFINNYEGDYLKSYYRGEKPV